MFLSLINIVENKINEKNALDHLKPQTRKINCRKIAIPSCHHSGGKNRGNSEKIVNFWLMIIKYFIYDCSHNNLVIDIYLRNFLFKKLFGIIM